MSGEMFTVQGVNGGNVEYRKDQEQSLSVTRDEDGSACFVVTRRIGLHSVSLGVELSGCAVAELRAWLEKQP